MAYNESRKKASIEYAKRSLKRIPLDVQKEKYDEIKAAADKAGETVNGYIKKAIEQRMENENWISRMTESVIFEGFCQCGNQFLLSGAKLLIIG